MYKLWTATKSATPLYCTVWQSAYIPGCKCTKAPKDTLHVHTQYKHVTL